MKCDGQHKVNLRGNKMPTFLEENTMPKIFGKQICYFFLKIIKMYCVTLKKNVMQRKQKLF